MSNACKWVLRLVENGGQHGNFTSMLFNGKVASKEITARGRVEFFLDSGKGPNLLSYRKSRNARESQGNVQW